MKFFISLLFLLGLVVACSETPKSKLLQQDQLTCYFFFVSDCPVARNNLPKIKELNDKYGTNVTFIGIVSDPHLDSGKLSSTLNEFNMTLEIQLDTTLAIAQKHNASVTPEVFLYNSKKQLIYSGAVDNYYYALGKHRKLTTKKYLNDAIEATLSQQSLEVSRTEPIGCYISFDL